MVAREPGRFEKVLLIGLDSAVPGRWRRYAEAGILPVGQRLLAEGAFAAECLPTFPTLTTTNWATIATGALPGTHGITDFNPHRPGDLVGDSLAGLRRPRRDRRVRLGGGGPVRAGQHRRQLAGQLAAPGGAVSALRRAAAGWRLRTGKPAGEAAPGLLTLVGGAGIELNEWRIGLPGMERRVALASRAALLDARRAGGDAS